MNGCDTVKTACYVRVSGDAQTTASQDLQLERYVAAYLPEGVTWYRETHTGRTMNRPVWLEMMARVESGDFNQILVWRLDRLGRSAEGLTALFRKLRRDGVNLIAMCDHVDLSTPSGRLMANIMAALAEYDSDLISDRSKAGIAASKAKAETAGHDWVSGGRQVGTLNAATRMLAPQVAELTALGHGVRTIADELDIDKNTVCRLRQMDRPE